MTGVAARAGGRLTAAAEELYDGDPVAFTERRAELAAEAKSAGDRTAAQAIGALRRPTRAAWVVNRLARANPSAPLELAELAAALRAAQQAGHGPRLRELSAARGALVDVLTRRAFSAAGVQDPPPALRLEVSQTLTAALADPGVAADFTAGRLTRAVQWSGFGVLPAVPGEAGADKAGADEAGADEAGAKPAAVVPGAASARPGRPGAARPSAEAAALRQAQEGERLAREAAELAAARREQYTAAERAVASTASAAADALAAEDRLEREVRDLEERLTRARADLAGARMRARHAEAAERRARQSLERLPRP